MANDITRIGASGIVPTLPEISPDLARVLDAETVGCYGGDEGSDGGADFRSTTWREPKWLPEPWRAEAERATPPHECAAAPATETMIRKFLLVLFNAERKNNGQDWEVSARTYLYMFRGWPAWCFRDEVLMRAGHHFKWFPSVAELSEWLMPEKIYIENRAYRLRFLSKLPNQPKAKRDAAAAGAAEAARQPWKPATPEEKAQATENLRAYRERPPTPFRASLSPETDRVGTDQTGVEARREAMARKDPAWAAYLETSRRMNMAREQAEWEARNRGGDTFKSLGEAANGAARSLGDVEWARFMVPLDQPLHGDLRAFYGHPCPGHEQPAVFSDEGAKNDMAPKSKARSFGVGESDGPFSPSPDAQEGAA